MGAGTTRARVVTGAGAAVLCLLAPWSIPAGPVPVSLGTLVIGLLPWALGRKGAWKAVLIYILLGAAGVPVFAGFSGGVGHLLGPTGGYIAGYLPMVLLWGWAARRLSGRTARAAGFLLGQAVLYLCGTAWFCLQTGSGPGAALALCVLPFLPGDGTKIAAALVLGPVLRDRLSRAGWNM